MAAIFTLTVPGKPVPRQRNAFVVKGRAMVTSDAKSTRYQRDVRVLASLEMARTGRKPFSDALEVWLTAYMPIPKSWPTKKKDAALAGVIRPVTTPDFDNAIKAFTDGCNGIVWTDDKIIVECHISKRYAATPRLEMMVAPVRTQLELAALESEAA